MGAEMGISAGKGKFWDFSQLYIKGIRSKLALGHTITQRAMEEVSCHHGSTCSACKQ